MDKLTPEQRRRNMQANKSKGTRIEIQLGKALWSNGLHYRKNDKTVYGRPDFVFKKARIAIFCDGEFWHGKDWDIHKSDHKSNCELWISKIERNIERDKEVNRQLIMLGWTVFRFWESEIITDANKCATMVKESVNKKLQNFEYDGITMAEIVKDEKNRYRIFGKHSLYDDGSIIPFDEQLAIITHYFQNINTPKSVPFKKKAIGLMEDIFNVTNLYRGIRLSLILESPLQYNLFTDLLDIPFPAPENPKFTFIDLFAGIGGFRIAMQNLGGKCVYSSEWDEQAKKTYLANYGEVPFGDITKETTKQFIPDEFDILCAGFPCQAFSMAGKKLGFEETRGTLFFDVAEIIRRKQPKAFFLENVKGLMIHDLRTGMCPNLGFSIKSRLGNSSTLINSSMATNFTYEITGVDLSHKQIYEINSIDSKSKIRDKLLKIKELGGSFHFIGVDSDVFNNNLVMIDSCLPQIVSELLLLYFSGEGSRLNDLVQLLQNNNPIGYNTENHHKFYEYKIKRLLSDAALGMIPATVWTGIFDANGGYLVVKEDGDILCYHLYNRNEFESYLLNTSYIDTPSSERHGFGSIIERNGKLIFKLNLQVRFL